MKSFQLDFDWEDVIRKNLFVLRCIGLWPRGDFYALDFYTFYAILAALILIFTYNLSQVIYIFHVYNDLEALSDVIFLGMTNLLAVGKFVCFVKNLRFIKQFFKTVNQRQFIPTSREQFAVMNPVISNWQQIYQSYTFVVCVIVGTWCCTPFLDGNFRTFELPFSAWYPFSVSKSPNYELIYLYQVICIWPMCIGNINIDLTIFAIMMCITAQCRLLCHNLKNLKTDFHLNLIRCIEHHKAILRFAESNNRIFSMIALGQMGTSIAVLAITMFQLTFMNPFSGEGMGHLLYIGGITLQILWYCYFGNRVEIESSEILYSLFESDWLEQSEAVKKNCLIFCMRCQKPIKMTAINLFALSLETFIKILRSSWSYFAVLYNVNRS